MSNDKLSIVACGKNGHADIGPFKSLAEAANWTIINKTFELDRYMIIENPDSYTKWLKENNNNVVHFEKDE